jgi:AAHS family 4-hydroxybenzoate transporter-like MFS transporter
LNSFDVAGAIENRKLNWFAVKITICLCAIMLTDGYDIQVMGFAAPSMVKDWHLDKASMGPIIGIGLFGLVIGSVALGYLGDRYGRKRAIVLSALFLGITSLAIAFARNIDEVFVLRFLSGIGIGGVLPNAVALATEYSPGRSRATSVWLMYIGYTFGAMGGAVVSASLIPVFGWPVMFVVGGVAPLLVGLFLIFTLPESLRFLALDPQRQGKARAILRQLAPEAQIDENTKLVFKEEKPSGFVLRHLFTEGRLIPTLLIWIAFAGNLMTLNFLLGWLPTVLQSPALSRGEAAMATALLQGGGLIGGLIVSRLMDKGGLIALAAVFAIGVPLVAGIGATAGAPVLLLVLLFGAGFCVIGAQPNLNAFAGQVYPTFVRSNGIGWANAIGRGGAIAGPVIGGVLIGMQLPIEQLFIAAAVPVFVGTLACFVLVYRNRRAKSGSAPQSVSDVTRPELVEVGSGSR